MKILIAEDEAISAKILRVTLERLGHQVVVTANGEEAWEVFDREPLRVVISDWRMPGIDGLDLCQKLRKREQRSYTYFILLTAVGTSAENYDLATTAGVDDFLRKPVDRAMIQMRLRVADRILSFQSEVQRLKERVPICCSCHKIHQEQGCWQRVETYVTERTGASFTHSLCPECLERELAKVEEMAAEES